MAPATGSALGRFEFDRRLRTLDADAFEAFVAGCWRTRGWAVERTAGLLVVTHPELGDCRTLSVCAVPWWRPRVSPSALGDPDADLVVVNRQVAGDPESVVGPAELHEMARYSIDPATRAELFREHLSRSDSHAERAIRRMPPGALGRYAPVIVTLAVLLAVAAAGLTVLSDDRPDPTGEDVGGSVPPVDVATERETPSAYAATRWPGSAGGYPPGLASDGVTDPAALASAHASRVARRPAELTLTVHEFADGRRVGTYEERVAVRDDWTFVSSIDRSGGLRSDHPTIAAVEMYAGEEGAYVRAPAARTIGGQEILLASPGDVTGIHHRVEGFLADVLATEESSVVETRQVGDATLHLVNGTRQLPDGGTENVSVLVTARGTIHAARVERDVPGTNRSVVVALGYTFGPVTVDPPPWVGNESVPIGRAHPSRKR